MFKADPLDDPDETPVTPWTMSQLGKVAALLPSDVDPELRVQFAEHLADAHGSHEPTDSTIEIAVASWFHGARHVMEYLSRRLRVVQETARLAARVAEVDQGNLDLAMQINAQESAMKEIQDLLQHGLGRSERR